jgi:hypothetical protein
MRSVKSTPNRDGAPSSTPRTIGEAADALGVHPRTLMSYERIGLVKPAREANRRRYSSDDVQWLRCLQDFNREGGISLQGLRTVLRFVPCWAVRSVLREGDGGECHPGRYPAGACLDRVVRAYEGDALPECRECGNYQGHERPTRSALEARTRS